MKLIKSGSLRLMFWPTIPTIFLKTTQDLSLTMLLKIRSKGNKGKNDHECIYDYSYSLTFEDRKKDLH